MNTTKGELQFLLKPLIFVSVLLLLFILLFTIGVNQVRSLIDKNNGLKVTQTTLSQKVAVLQKVSTIISGDTTFLDVVIPSKGAILYGLSQVKNQAAGNTLLLSNIKTGAQSDEKGGVSKATITFDAEGQASSIYQFLNSFSKSLPIMTIDKVKISNSGSSLRATISLGVYSAELPKTIPSVSSNTAQLTTDEMNLLKELVTYTLPIFVEPKPQDTPAKSDPFN
jgi:Tfp pilus assembly protein PilO